MNLINNACNLVALICAIFSLGFIISFIKLKLFKKENEKPFDWFDDISKWYYNYPIRFIIIGIVVIGFTIWSCAWFKELVGYDNIESKPSGTYCYYVEVSSNKKYVLPAKVNVDVYTDEASEGQSTTYRDYYIEKVYWSNGGYLYFGDEDERIELDAPITLYDQNEIEWEVKLVNKTAYCPDFKDTSAFDSPVNVIFGIFIITSEIFVWLFCITYNKKKD